MCFRFDLCILSYSERFNGVPFMLEFFGRPFAKQFALYYRTIICLFVLSVTGVLWPNTCMDQDELGAEVGLGPGQIMLDGDPAPSPKSGRAPPNFRPMFVVDKQLDGLRCHLVWR